MTATIQRLVAGKCVDVLRETLGVDEDELASLFRRTFQWEIIMNNFQMLLVSQCYREWGHYRFDMNSTDMDGLVRSASRATKPFYMHSINVRAWLTCGIMSNIW